MSFTTVSFPKKYMTNAEIRKYLGVSTNVIYYITKKNKWIRRQWREAGTLGLRDCWTVNTDDINKYLSQFN